MITHPSPDSDALSVNIFLGCPDSFQKEDKHRSIAPVANSRPIDRHTQHPVRIEVHLLCCIDLVNGLKESQVVFNRIPKLTSFKARASTVNDNNDVR